jgi:hypothetical protein
MATFGTLGMRAAVARSGGRLPDRLKRGKAGRIGLQRVGRFGAGLAKRGSVDEYAWIGGVDHGRFNAADSRHIEAVARPSGGEQTPGFGASRVVEFEADCGCGTGDAVDGKVAIGLRLAIRHGEARRDDLVGVGGVDAHGRGAITRRGAEAFFGGERAHGRRHVAAIAAVVDRGVLYRRLGEGIVDIRIGTARRPDDTNFRKRGDAATHAIELATVRIGRSHDCQKDVIPGGGIGRQIAALEHHGLGCSAAHEHGSDAFLRHAVSAGNSTLAGIWLA